MKQCQYGAMDDPAPLCALDSALDEDQAVQLAVMFKALADPARLRLISLIAASPDREICACDAPSLIDRTQPTVSHHLSILVRAGLLEREQRGRWAWFRLAPNGLRAARNALDTPAPH